MALTVKKIPMPAEKYSIKCPYIMNPTRIVIHNTANDAAAMNEIKYMQSNNSQTSFHYAVDDKEAVQGVELWRNAWHAGDGAEGTGNRYGIAIEICYSKSGGTKFEKAEKNAAAKPADEPVVETPAGTEAAAEVQPSVEVKPVEEPEGSDADLKAELNNAKSDEDIATVVSVPNVRI